MKKFELSLFLQFTKFVGSYLGKNSASPVWSKIDFSSYSWTRNFEVSQVHDNSDVKSLAYLTFFYKSLVSEELLFVYIPDVSTSQCDQRGLAPRSVVLAWAIDIPQ